jgi:hypothetical protein
MFKEELRLSIRDKSNNNCDDDVLFLWLNVAKSFTINHHLITIIFSPLFTHFHVPRSMLDYLIPHNIIIIIATVVAASSNNRSIRAGHHRRHSKLRQRAVLVIKSIVMHRRTMQSEGNDYGKPRGLLAISALMSLFVGEPGCECVRRSLLIKPRIITKRINTN